jgi:hypothetical protein
LLSVYEYPWAVLDQVARVTKGGISDQSFDPL